MPLIMEDDQYMEDLFNDTEPIHLTAPQPSLKGFARRLDELHSRGCCRKVEWAANGCVASISKDGRALRMQAFARNPADGKWNLQLETHPAFPALNEDTQLVHVSWGPIGQDLAVLDSSGHIMIFTSRSALGRMHLSRTPNSDSEDELGEVVGMSWLPIFPHQHKVRFVHSAERSGSSWQLRTKDHYWKSPHNCLENKGALVCMTKLGVLRLLFQQVDGGWEEVTAEVGAEQTAEDTFSHAAFCLHDGLLVLAAYSMAGRLHLFRIKINWGSVPPRQQNPQETPKNMQPPSLGVTPILTEDEFVPYGPGGEDILLQTSHRMAIPAQLTHLEFLKPAPESDDQHVTPTIFAVFSSTPALVAPIDQAQSHQNPTSIVCRWSLEENQQNVLHPSFAQLPNIKKKSADPESQTRLKRLPDLLTGATILALMPLTLNTIVALYQSDGSLDFRNTITMQSISAEYSTDNVSSLLRAGFTFSFPSPALHIALSASTCVATTMGSDMEVKIKTMEYNHGSLQAAEDDSKIEAAMAALTLQHTLSINQYYSSDDILALVPAELPTSRVTYLLHLLYRGMNMKVDCTNPQPQEVVSFTVGRNPALIKCLSAQATLGSQQNEQRPLAATLANATLNIRYTSFVMLLVMQTHRQKTQPSQPGQPPATSQQNLGPVLANGLVGISKWMMDYTLFLWSELWIASRHFLDNELTIPSLQAYMFDRNTPALLTLLCSFPRALLRDWLLTLRWIQRSAETPFNPKDPRYASQPQGPQLRNAFQALFDVFNERQAFHPLLKHLDALLADVDTAVKKAYADAKTNDNQRNALEQNMFVAAEVPATLLPAVRHILLESFGEGDGSMLERIDLAEVLFRDFSWLGVSTGRGAQAFEKDNVLDVLRKTTVRVKKGMQVKRCTRGCAYAEDLSQAEVVRMQAGWYYGVSKNCTCGSAWTLVEIGGEEEKKKT